MDQTPGSEVRVRFAPSPTGLLHVGSARAALYNWLFARHTGGRFLLRIEDTDLERSTDESTKQILDSLAWLGLTPDEPVEYQTRRLDRHKAYLQKLLESGAAYKCYCSKERLEQLREQSRREGRTAAYDKHCIREKDAVARHEAAGDPCVIRFNVPEDGVTVLDDMIYGRIEFENRQIGDFVLARPDGSPVYNFTNAVDDIDMRITHVCRGEDHVPNTPKQILIYRGLGAEPPRFAHLPLILGPDKTKLSKRHGATGVTQFHELGILPHALINFLVLLGWSPEGGEFEEVMSIDELISKFSLEKVNRSPAVFDYEKLLWMNGMHIRRMPREEIYAAVLPKLNERYGEVPAEARNGELNYEAWLRALVDLAVERSRTMNDFPDVLSYFFLAPVQYDEKGVKKSLSTPEHVALLRESGDALAKINADQPGVSMAELEERFRAWSAGRGYKFGQVVHPLRLALTGVTAGVGLFDIIHYLGPQETEKRIAAAVAKLGATSTVPQQ